MDFLRLFRRPAASQPTQLDPQLQRLLTTLRDDGALTIDGDDPEDELPGLDRARKLGYVKSFESLNIGQRHFLSRRGEQALAASV